MSEDGGICKPMRKKYWSEMTDAERIPVLQSELIRTQRQLSSLCQYVSKLIGHDHMNGRLVAGIENPNCESYGGISFRVEEFKDK